MAHTTIADLAEALSIQSGSVVSKVIHRDDTMNVTVFGFDVGEELTEHRSPRHAIIHVLSGRLALTVDGEEIDAGPGCWVHMEPETQHSLTAREPTVMLLTMV